MLLREGADTEVRTPSEYHLQIVHDESKQKSWEASGENSEGWDHRRAHSTFESSERTTFTHGMFPTNYI